MNFATLDTVTLQYVVEGRENGPPLVFVNSLGTDLRIWDGVVTHFRDRFHIVRHDKRGHGLSDAPDGPYTITDHANDLHQLLQHLGIDNPIVVGISVGGLIALQYATQHAVRALILADTGARLGSESSWNERIAAIRERGMEGMADIIARRWFAPSFSQREAATFGGYRNMMARMPAEGYTGTCAALRDADLRDVVSTIEAPSLVLCGAEDVATLPEFVRGLAEALPNARFETIAGAGHLPCVEQPDEMAMKMDRFLRENGYG
jgi:3-oxoadipate enol-lactonase